MNYILFDDVQIRQQLLPFTFTRPVADIRLGIDTIREKWERYLGQAVSVLTEDYLSGKYPLHRERQNVLINASVLPDAELVATIKALQMNQVLSFEDTMIAHGIESPAAAGAGATEEIEYMRPFRSIENNWDLFLLNGGQICLDFVALTRGRHSAPISVSNRVIAPENIFVEEGATVEMAMLNASEGPIYIGKDAEIMEGAMLRGPLVVGHHSVVKIGAQMAGRATMRPH
ncbi:MAG: glucose-1-phosphate thymidylyltransferase, partial [Bacteroidales bacterium]|nr:glucose-1-phosphate thymidylyltransferase [Bacteroidales bacterium]